jgi:DNA-binding PadR family transcriptional regulator
MKSDTAYTNHILTTWEQTFHKGQLTFWILIGIKESPKCLEEIQLFIKENTNNIIVFDEQSIYRALRRFYDVELVDFELRDSERGPQRKYFSLTKIGSCVLNQFVDRNIKLFYNKSLQNILNKK